MEKLVHRQLSTHLESEALSTDAQYSFRKQLSTIHAFAQVTYFVSKKLDARLPTAAIFIDSKKAFDCVQHPTLKKNLKALGLSEVVVRWIVSYLSDRQQRVYANNTYSGYQGITQGVPQGSVLGPLFYIAYANDLSKIVKHCKRAMYADDTVLYTSHKNFDVSIRDLQEDID